MLETHKMLALSTGHLTLETAQWLNHKIELDGMKRPVCYDKSSGNESYGWFIPIVEGRVPANIPLELQACMTLAHQQGCDWLMFDRDVDEVPHLPTYEW